MSNLGRKLVLWRVEYKADAYIDQMDRAHDGYIVIAEYPVTITEVKQVPNMFDKGTSEGWMAETEDGHVFTCNWKQFPDDSMTL